MVQKLWTPTAQRLELERMLGLWYPCGSWRVVKSNGEFVATNESGEPYLPPQPSYPDALREWLRVISELRGLV